MKSKIFLILILLLLTACNIFFGSVSIPAEEVFRVLLGGEATKNSWTYIILESRLPQAITAMLCGASLAASGLLLQTCFRNHLAGPSILGITNGASLGVAIVTLALGGIVGTLVGHIAIIIAAFLGAAIIISIILALSSIVRNNLMLLIVGIMISYLTSSVVSLCNFFASADSIQSYVSWGMGSFSDVTLQQLPLFSTLSVIGLLLSLLLIKPLNAMLLGDNYAQNLGINIRLIRNLILLTTGILSAVTTAYCGPIAFLGLATPHMARLLTKTSNHTTLMPATILLGAAIALLCNLICTLPGTTIIPLNAVTPVFGAPIIIYIIFKKKH